MPITTPSFHWTALCKPSCWWCRDLGRSFESCWPYHEPDNTHDGFCSAQLLHFARMNWSTLACTTCRNRPSSSFESESNRRSFRNCSSRIFRSFAVDNSRWRNSWFSGSKDPWKWNVWWRCGRFLVLVWSACPHPNVWGSASSSEPWTSRYWGVCTEASASDIFEDSAELSTFPIGRTKMRGCRNYLWGTLSWETCLLLFCLVTSDLMKISWIKFLAFEN